MEPDSNHTLAAMHAFEPILALASFHPAASFAPASIAPFSFIKKVAVVRCHCAIFIGMLTSVLALSFIESGFAEDKMVRIYYGTKNQAGSEGIYTGTLDLDTGKLSAPHLAIAAQNAGFLAISGDQRMLYAVASGSEGQRIVAYQIDRSSGKLAFKNSQETGGVNPCHVSVGPEDRYVVYACYTGGSCGLMPLAKDGELEPRSSFFQHEGGSGVVASRQKAPHPHSAMTAASGGLVMVPDLGQDKIRIYRVDEDGRGMTANDPPTAAMPAGGGPRHVTFHPNGRWMYSNNEITSSVTMLQLDPATGETKQGDTVSTLPDGPVEGNSTAEVLIHPSGKFLYCSNRGHDSIAAFAVDQNTGALRPIGHASSGGKTPRNFGITPDGDYLVAANQSSNDVIVLKVDQGTGKLTPTGSRIKVPHCICVRFVK